jgi:acyl carrier protein phosphodiesterase
LNYLAHIFLSGSDQQIKIGNFIGDFVKGTRYEQFPDKIREGVLLHRRIDEFTDSHPVVRQTVAFLRPAFGRYSAIVADMYFDYFLAKNFRKYASMSLTIFACKFYIAAILHYSYLPERVKGFIFHFIGTNRLVKYASTEGLFESLQIMSAYKIPTLDPGAVIHFLVEHQEILEVQFSSFFPDIIYFVENECIIK